MSRFPRPAPETPPLRIAFGPAKPVRAVLEERWTLKQGAGRGVVTVYLPLLPELPHQGDCSTALSLAERPDLRAVEVAEAAPGRRALLALRVPVGDGRAGGLADGASFTVRGEYRARLRARDLVPGPPAAPVAALPPAERAACLAATRTVDFDGPDFSRWLDERRLRRRAPSEDALAFGRRVFDHLRATFRYGGDTRDYAARFASRTCRAGASDCGGLSILFVAAMRAGGVPARTLVGRWALSQDGDNGQHHVVAEFYADGIGWVPVDLAGSIVHDPKPPFFGRTDPGPFLAFHAGTDVTPVPGFWHGWAQYALLHAGGFADDPLRGGQTESRWFVY